jgi:RimJ/RimL family protein N-acetyltransferase
MRELLKGQIVRLSAADHEELAKAYAIWNRDSELTRLLDSNAARLHSAKAGADFFKKMLEDAKPEQHFFSIRALDDDRLLGDINLDVINNWNGRTAFVGINIGERSNWGKGYGTDAMQIVLRYAFTEINLNRVMLNVFEYNPRAIRSYEKAGFKHEGRARGGVLREGKRWDVVYMGILRDEWLTANK